MTNRLDVRLDAEHRRRLEEVAQERGMPISEVVRCLIDVAYEDILGTPPQAGRGTADRV